MAGEPLGVAAHDAGIHAELGLRELRAGRDLGGELDRLPVRRRIDRRVGRPDEEPRLAGDLAAGRQLAAFAASARAMAVSVVESMSNTALVFGLVAGLGVVAGESQQVAGRRSRPRP